MLGSVYCCVARTAGHGALQPTPEHCSYIAACAWQSDAVLVAATPQRPTPTPPTPQRQRRLAWMGSGVSAHRSAECGFKGLRERILEREHALRELAVVQLRVLHAHTRAAAPKRDSRRRRRLRCTAAAKTLAASRSAASASATSSRSAASAVCAASSCATRSAWARMDRSACAARRSSACIAAHVAAQYADVVAAGNRPPALSEVEYCEYAVIARYGLRLLPRMRPHGLRADTLPARKAKPCAQLRRGA